MVILIVRRKLQGIDSRRILYSFLKTIFASLLMGIAGWSLIHGKQWQIHGGTFIKVFYLSGTIALSVIMYILLSYILRNEELNYVVEMVKQKLRK